MKLKPAVALSAVCLLAADDAPCKTRFSEPHPVMLLHVLPSVRRWNVSAAPPIAEIGRGDVWETAAYLALSACGLFGIGVGLFSW